MATPWTLEKELCGLGDAATAAEALCHGFCPVSPFHGLRTDGTHVFAVDFGQDLGPPGLALGRKQHLLREALSWFGRVSGQPVDEGRARRLFAIIRRTQ
jgi:hypothetical protein